MSRPSWFWCSLREYGNVARRHWQREARQEINDELEIIRRAIEQVEAEDFPEQEIQ